MPDPSKHADSRNFVESILRYIPGFRGYLEKDYRRESDYLARTWMADRLQRSKPSLDNYMLALTSDGQLDALDDVERIRTHLDGLINRFRADVRGYSGFFDFVRVNEALLDSVYAHDMALMNHVNALAESLEQLAQKPDTPQSVVADLLRQIDELQRQFQRRSDLLQGVAD